MGDVDLVGIALIITAVGTTTAGIITALVAYRSIPRIEAKVDVVHDEVKTGNGKTLGMLGDLTEGRRALEIPEAERTASERQHVAMLEADERNA